MARPIASTPVFEGQDLKDLIEYSNSPLTKEEKEYIEELKKVRDVPVFGI